MSEKRKEPFRFRTGFFFGAGFVFAGYLVMLFMEGFLDFAMMMFGIVMRGLGYEPGIYR